MATSILEKQFDQRHMFFFLGLTPFFLLNISAFVFLFWVTTWEPSTA